MAKFGRILVVFWCLFLAFLPACSASQFHSRFCTKNSQVDTRTKPEGNIVFPLTTLNYPAKLCHVTIRSSLDDRTELTLVNVQRKHCFENSIEIFVANYSLDYSRYQFCKSVGSRETITLRSTIRLIYRAPFRNVIGVNSTEHAISVQYKRLRSTKPCRHVLTARSGVFQNSGYPNYPQEGECEWLIDTGKGEGISLKFDINYIHRLNCDNNYIEVREGDSIGPVLLKICQHFPETEIKTSSTKLWIQVKSSTTSGIGFQATYSTEIEICKVVTANGKLDFRMPEKTSCQAWNLTAPSGQIAALSFSNVNLLSSDSVSCKSNVLEVWDGETTTSYCNLKRPPQIIMSKGRKLVVTYRSKNDLLTSFEASFTSIYPSSYKANCFVRAQELSFKCNNQQVIPCVWQCDGAMQCSDNSDETPCSDVQERWHKLQVFVIVIGSICSSTVIFCIGLICFRRFIIRSDSTSSARQSRRLSVTDQSPLTPNADLPSPPPCYFTDRDEEPPASVIRGTYFFGDEFSQSGIHSASLFGIPPPRYRSTESLHQSNTETRSIWQRGMSSIPLVPTDSSTGTLVEEDPPDYESVSADKDNQIANQNNPVSIENAACAVENPECSSNECIANENGFDTEVAIELQTHVTNTSDTDIGIMNAGATLKV